MSHTDQPKILVVNDDPRQLSLTSGILAKEGGEVLTCSGVAEVLQVLLTCPKADLIITDLYMPDIDGWRFCSLLRSPEYAGFDAIPILVVSATFSGADGFLSAPYKPALLRERVRELLAGQTPRRTARVLIIEDSQTHAALLRQVFETHGYAVLVAYTGEDGRACFVAEHPEVVIIDYHPPDMLGYELITTFRSVDVSSVIVMITADTAPDLAAQFLSCGADDYIRKPFAPEYILARCQHAQRRRSLLRVEHILEERTLQLRQSEERYRNLFELASDGIATLSLDGHIADVNKTSEDMLGWGREELVGQPVTQFLTQPSMALAQEWSEKIRSDVLEPKTFELDLLKKDGAVIAVECCTRYIHDKSGHTVGIQGTYRDQSTKKEMEKRRTEFIAMLSHDIKNPLGVIVGYADLLLEEMDVHGLSEEKGVLERIRTNALTVHALVVN